MSIHDLSYFDRTLQAFLPYIQSSTAAVWVTERNVHVEQRSCKERSLSCRRTFLVENVPDEYFVSRMIDQGNNFFFMKKKFYHPSELNIIEVD